MSTIITSARKASTRHLCASSAGWRGPLAWLAVGVLALLLSGCASTREAAGKTWQVMKDPSIPVGYPEARLSRVDLAMVAEPDVNRNFDGEGTPLRFQILQLKDDSMLMAADHYQLRDDLEDALGTNYLTHDDFTLLPGQWKFYEPFEVDEETRYIGLIAFYNTPDEAEWKKVVKVNAVGDEYHLLVHLRADEAELRDQD
ncbi:type VI secretion system lipoprotein TssJ [Billgrantia montanilacus]|uniref:Type VI secretion system lipoprotein TssJ n=1 Tax=Billgrantia montanilacus TaxID=2282305 RepID=A0A368TW07_9GAMM|nr:type VI secretion system lipoprotein TssJ [Halomonas montanilacus]RCV88870.1 type VI secretion system lipoprotein TssJ [Halomonas montanilacus]